MNLTTFTSIYYSLKPLGKEQTVKDQGSLAQWLEQKCKAEHLSLRRAGARTGVSHATIQHIIKGSRPLPRTIKKIARGFGGDGADEGLALEDRLLMLAGYIREDPCQAEYLKIIPLLSPKHQHILEVLVRELAKIEGIEVPIPESGHSSGQSSKGEC